MAQLVGSFTACYSSPVHAKHMHVCVHLLRFHGIAWPSVSLPPPHLPIFPLQAAAAALPFFSIYFLSSPLVFMLLYLWSREQPTANVSIMGFVTVPVSGGNGEVAKGLV